VASPVQPILRCVYRSEVPQHLSPLPQKRSATHWSFAPLPNSEMQPSSETKTSFAMKHLSCLRPPQQRYRRSSGLHSIQSRMLTMLSSSRCLWLPLQ
jgi:hypothetical protein